MWYCLGCFVSPVPNQGVETVDQTSALFQPTSLAVPKSSSKIILPALLESKLWPTGACPNDVRLFEAGHTKQQQVCALFVNRVDSRTTIQCTAWFVGPKHVVTAGSCIARGGSGAYDISTTIPSFICCKFSSPGVCAPGSAWKVVRWITTRGWLSFGSWEYNGAVLKVEPIGAHNCTNGGAAQRYGFWAKAADVPPHIASAVGVSIHNYESDNVRGCKNLAARTLYGSLGYVSPLVSPTSNGRPVHLYLPACGGVEGGMVKHEQSNTAWGIIVLASTDCVGGSRSFITAVQITDGTTTAGGADVAAMIRAIP